MKGSKKKKQKGAGTGNSAGGNSGGGAKTTSGEGSYHIMLFYMLYCLIISHFCHIVVSQQEKLFHITHFFIEFAV